MNIDFTFTLCLNIFSGLVLLCCLSYEFKQYQMNRNSKYIVHIHNHALFITNMKLVILVLAYTAAITALWLLFFFGVSEIIHKHWFAFGYLLFLTLIIYRDKITFSIGHDGLYLNTKLTPWHDIVHYHLEESDRFDNKLSLEIKTKNDVLRGIVPADSKTKLIDLLQNIPSNA